MNFFAFFTSGTFAATLLLAATAQARPLRGEYIIPTTDPLLQSHNHFPVRLKTKEDSYQNPSEIKYPLPQAITGRPIVIEMSIDAKGKGAGELIAQASCRRVGRYLECPVEYTDLKIDAQQVRDYLAKLPISQEETDALSQLSQAFSNEPAGILRYRLKGKNRQ